MNLRGLFYAGTDIARPLVRGELPQKKQYAFLEWLHGRETIFLPPEWRGGDDGFRKMLLAVQNAVSYLVDRNAFENERKPVEEEGGFLPDENSASGPWPFLKNLRIELALAEFQEPGYANRKRLKCRTIMTRCGIQRRTEAFCRDFALAAAFYHIGLHPSGGVEAIWAIEDFSITDHLFMKRL